MLLSVRPDRVWHPEAETGPLQCRPPATVPQNCAVLGGGLLPGGFLRAAEISRILPVCVLRRGGGFRRPGAHHFVGQLTRPRTLSVQEWQR